jgi:hypothetical protein
VEDAKTRWREIVMRMQIMMTTTTTSWNGADDINVKAAARAAAVARLNDSKNGWWRETNNNKNDHTTCYKNNKRIVLKEMLWLNDLQGDAYRIRKRRMTQRIHTFLDFVLIFSLSVTYNSY